MHPNQTGNLDLLAGSSVEDQTTAPEFTLVHTHVRQLAVTAFLELESQANKWRIGSWHKRHRRRGRRQSSVEGLRGYLGRVGQVSANAIKQRLHRSVLVRGTHENRCEAQAHGGTTHRLCNVMVADWLLIKEEIAERLIGVG